MAGWYGTRVADPEPDLVFKILICWIRIRPKMDRIRNPGRYHLQDKILPTFGNNLGTHLLYKYGTVGTVPTNFICTVPTLV